jgi:mannose-1-phosphate guanylyltransferase
MMRVRSAFRLVERRPDLIVVLGIVPDYPAMNRGWIEPGDPVPYASEAPSFRIRRFWERPLMHRAEALMARGCLWNSQVVVGSADALLLLIQQCAPFLYQAFAPARPMLGTVKERDAVEGVYANLLKTDFSKEVMAVAPQVLAVMAVERNGQSEVTDHGRTVPLMAPNRQWRGAGG